MTVKEFATKTLPAALQAGVKYGVNPIGMMAQSAVETGWGKSTPGNMWFGIKADSSWKGQKQLLTTKEVVNGETVTRQSWFRKYASMADSFDDYGKFIANNRRRYAAALAYPDYSQADNYIKAVASAGYATATNYYTTVKSCADKIKQYITDDIYQAALESLAKKKYAAAGIAIMAACLAIAWMVRR